MKQNTLFILLALFYIQSYSQEFGKINYDSHHQVKYKDTIQSIGRRITGKWKYLGTRQNETLSDTIGGGTREGKWTYDVVENGIAYEIVNGKRQKVGYYYQITFDFEKPEGTFKREKKYLNENIVEFSSDQPIPQLIYYKGSFGILFIEMVGEHFVAIRELNDEKLILENGKEYFKIE